MEYGYYKMDKSTMESSIRTWCMVLVFSTVRKRVFRADGRKIF